MISDQEASEKANQYIESLKEKQIQKGNQTTFYFYKKGKMVGSFSEKGSPRVAEYKALTMSKMFGCKVKIRKVETYI